MIQGDKDCEGGGVEGWTVFDFEILLREGQGNDPRRQGL